MANTLATRLRLCTALLVGLGALSCTQTRLSEAPAAQAPEPETPVRPAAPVTPPKPVQPPGRVQPPPPIRPEPPLQGVPNNASAMPVPEQLGYASHPGKEIYEKNCAVCHNNPEATRSPALDSLQRMRYQMIDYALTQGKMQAQGALLSAAQRTTLIEYLVGKTAISDEWIAGMMCKPPGRSRAAGVSNTATVTGFGFDLRNQRRLTRTQSGLGNKDFEKLELSWAMAFPGSTVMRAQPTVVGSMLYLPVADAARVFAIDISKPATPCLKWTYESDAPLRTGAAFAKLKGSGRNVLAFGDLAATVHLVDADTGAALWKQRVAISPYSLTTGTPVIHEDRVYVPISQYEIGLGANDDHECCTSHGAVTALDATNGNKIWTAHTMPDAKPVRDRGDGKMLLGPSGAPIWNSPAIDTKRGVLYVGTGEATSEPAAKTTDAILAIDLKDGALRWSFQATENDIFLSGCGRNRKGLNCPKDSVSRDVDFGASVIIAKRADGSDVLLAGQKSGQLWALDPDQQGKVLWQRDFGEGSPLGGIHWGIAVDGERVFAPINRPYGRPAVPGTSPERPQKTGLNAVRVDTGELLWSYVPEPDCTGDRQLRMRGCANNIGFSAAPTVIDGVVVSGSLDGFLRAFDAASGKLLFQFDTAQTFEGINGVRGNGGSIDNATIVAANGYLFVGSGYGLFGQAPGNVLLAFRPKPAKG